MFKPLNRIWSLTNPPPQVLTGDEVSRAAAQIEKELGDVKVPYNHRDGIVVDEVQLWGKGQLIGTIPIAPVTVRLGETVTMTDIKFSVS
jgi:hypothetical protein